MKKLRGIVVSLVLSALLALPVSASSFSTDLKYGMYKNDDVKRLQEYLKKEKLYSGPITGNYYSLTKTAVSKLQKKNKLKVTGKFDLATRNNVNSLLAKNDPVDDEAQQLAESIKALKMYEETKTQTQPIPQPVTQVEQQIAQNIAPPIITPEQFAVLHPEIKPLQKLPNEQEREELKKQRCDLQAKEDQNNYAKSMEKEYNLNISEDYNIIENGYGTENIKHEKELLKEIYPKFNNYTYSPYRNDYGNNQEPPVLTINCQKVVDEEIKELIYPPLDGFYALPTSTMFGVVKNDCLRGKEEISRIFVNLKSNISVYNYQKQVKEQRIQDTYGLSYKYCMSGN